MQWSIKLAFARSINTLLHEPEQRMLKAISAISSPQRPAMPNITPEEPQQPLSPKSCRLLEARTDDLVSLPRDSTWGQVRDQLEKIPKAKLKTFLSKRDSFATHRQEGSED